MARPIQLIAVQMRLSIACYENRSRFEEKIRSLMKRVKEHLVQGIPSLVVFPEDVGTSLLFLDEGIASSCTTVREAVQKLLLRRTFPIAGKMMKYRVGILRAAMLSKAAAAGKVYHEVFSAMAGDYGVYLVAGSASLPDFFYDPSGKSFDFHHIRDGNIYNVSYFYGPDGGLIGTQKKVHLVEGLEDAKGFGFSAGSMEALHALDMGTAKVGIAICLDSFQQPVIQKLADDGAEILIQPSANAGSWNAGQQEDWMRSSWTAVHNEPRLVAAVNPMMTGNLFDLIFEGQSSIITRRAKGKSGYLDMPLVEGFAAVARSYDEEEILSAVIDLDD